jgi:hypothetical protein
MDVRAELSHIDAKAAAGTALAAAVLVGLATVQTPLPDPVVALGIGGAAALTIALVLFLGALLPEGVSGRPRAGLGLASYHDGAALAAALKGHDRAVYHATVAVDLSAGSVDE